MAIPGVKLKKDDILNALIEKKGNKASAARMLGCSRQAIHSWCETDEEIKKALEKARQESIDEKIELDDDLVQLAYESIRDLLLKRDITATIYTLKTKGKWGEGDSRDMKITIQPIERPYDNKPKE